MTCISRWIRTATMATAVGLLAAGASAQAPAHEHATSPDTATSGRAARPSGRHDATAMMHKDVLSRMESEDAELEALVADMKMLTGDLKIEAMVRTLTLVVERQLKMNAQMMDMHRRAMRDMMGVITGSSAEGAPEAPAGESASGTMYLPPAH